MKEYIIKIQRSDASRQNHYFKDFYEYDNDKKDKKGYYMGEKNEAKIVGEKEGKKLIEEIKTIYEKYPNNGKLIKIGLYNIKTDELIEDECDKKIIQKFTRFQIMDI